MNLSTTAIYFPSNLFGDTSRDFHVRGVNNDVNGDGTYESILKFTNPLTRDIESRLIEKDGNAVRLRKFEVVNGKIDYLPE